MKKGLMLDQNKINVLCIDNAAKVTFDLFMENIPYRYKVGIKDRKSLITTLTEIQVDHIKEGIILVCNKNYKLDTISFKLSSYLNKVYIRQHVGMGGKYTDSFVVNNNGKRMNITKDVILQDLKVKSRLFKVKKLRDINDKKINVHYVIKVGDDEQNFNFYITEEDTKMTWDEFNALSDNEKHDIIVHHYNIDIDTKIKHNIVSINTNF